MTEPDRATGVSVPPPPPWASPPTVPADAAPTSAPTSAAEPAPPTARETETVTVSSAAVAAPATPQQSVASLPKPIGKRRNKPLIAVATALGLVVLVAIVLAVMPRGSTTEATTPVGPLAVTGEGGDGHAPPDETQPTTPPSTAPPTTQALPPAPVVNHVTTTDPVVFITIDDGWHVPPEARAQLMSGTVPITTFVLQQVLDKDPELWASLGAASGSIENHSISHPAFAKLSLQQQQEQICSTSEAIASKTGRYPTMFRPPYGSTNSNTSTAAGNCGIKYMVMWGASVNGGKIAFAKGDALHAGDIVLLHYRPELAEDLAAVLTAAQAAGLKPAHLSDYLN